MEIDLDEIVHEMHDLEQQMGKFEWKYSIKSAEFYKLVERGKLDETADFHEWLGLYRLWLRRHDRYLAMLRFPSPLVKLAHPLEDDFFAVEEVAL